MDSFRKQTDRPSRFFKTRAYKHLHADKHTYTHTYTRTHLLTHSPTGFRRCVKRIYLKRRFSTRCRMKYDFFFKLAIDSAPQLVAIESTVITLRRQRRVYHFCRLRLLRHARHAVPADEQRHSHSQFNSRFVLSFFVCLFVSSFLFLFFVSFFVFPPSLPHFLFLFSCVFVYFFLSFSRVSKPQVVQAAPSR